MGQTRLMKYEKIEEKYVLGERKMSFLVQFRKNSYSPFVSVH